MSAFGSENGDPNENNNPRPPPPRPSNEEIQVLRGTDIEVSTVTKTFSEFLREFRSVEDSKIRSDLNAREKAIEEGESFDDELPQPDPTLKPHYLEILSKTFNSQSTAIELDCVHLYYHSPSTRRLYDWLESYPQEIVVQMDTCIREIFEEFYGESELPLQVRPFHFRTVSHMRSLSPESIDSMVTLRGMVLRSSPIIPDLKIGHFKCQVCGAARESTIDRGRISEPTTCDENGCGSRHSFALVHNRSTYTDKQLVRLQETPSEVPAGETPASITLFAYDDIVDSVRPGDRVEVTGVFRASPKRPNPKRTVCRAVFRTYVDVIHFRIVEAGEMGSASKVNSSFTDKRVEEIKELSKRPNVYEELTAALAPSIWELDDVKKGVLCMLFGGNQNHRAEHEDEENDEEQIVGNKGRKSNKRGDINILLCGDPGTSKSQLLGQVHKLAPRGVYTSGKGSSAVGLTASVVRDPETRDLVLESGALVLSDQGVCCIDEFDKMSETTRAILHEAMEQQTVR
ncbi:hypothetical protein TL16_g05278 [Triparma laevis f. inornata]|uniref:DNA replication licensing factor MCM4 n=1 Tax=Triparma laevis f. inornata TaxID=1714386 RepID=A0A9W7ALE6_9STRA|nr:hypothetical protein TL16_g05278 [Triparma laevis f. inornata]